MEAALLIQRRVGRGWRVGGRVFLRRRIWAESEMSSGDGEMF